MNGYTVTLIWTSALSFASLATLLSRYVDDLRAGREPRNKKKRLGAYVSPVVDHSLVVVRKVRQKSARGFYKGLLALLTRFVPWLVGAMRKIERSLFGFVDSIQGKGQASMNGNASTFLEDIRKHQKKVRNKKK